MSTNQCELVDTQNEKVKITNQSISIIFRTHSSIFFTSYFFCFCTLLLSRSSLCLSASFAASDSCFAVFAAYTLSGHVLLPLDPSPQTLLGARQKEGTHLNGIIHNTESSHTDGGVKCFNGVNCE